MQSFCDAEARQAPSRRTVAPKALGDFVGRDEKILRIFETLSLAAATCAPILIQGETGTGKDLLARAAHGLSSRRDGPFVKINCAALPEPLLESELFGYKKGAFTDARTDKPGILQMAQGGTVFFDEIGELPLGLQSKLLQVIEERRFHPWGPPRRAPWTCAWWPPPTGTSRPWPTPGGSGATCTSACGCWRSRCRPCVAGRGTSPFWCAISWTRWAACTTSGWRARTPAVMAILFGHDYPGNVRELLHVVEHAVILAKDTVLHPRDLPRSLNEAASGAARSEAPPPTGGPLERSERECLLAELEACAGTWPRRPKSWASTVPPCGAR